MVSGSLGHVNKNVTTGVEMGGKDTSDILLRLSHYMEHTNKVVLILKWSASYVVSYDLCFGTSM